MSVTEVNTSDYGAIGRFVLAWFAANGGPINCNPARRATSYTFNGAK